jgi:hypothetical protein
MGALGAQDAWKAAKLRVDVSLSSAFRSETTWELRAMVRSACSFVRFSLDMDE